MLQQTQVRTMLPFYKVFLERFPDISALAEAQIEEVLEFWKGLGYYHRARNLHRAANILLKDYGAKFPADLSAALLIPGVGPYTARAVLSFSYGLPWAVLDANVKRVLLRLFFIRREVPGMLQKQAQDLLETATEGRKNYSRLHNMALMELGSLICKPKNPDCPACPLVLQCKIYNLGGPEWIQKIPFPSQKKFISLEPKLYAILAPKKGRSDCAPGFAPSFLNYEILIHKEKDSRFLKDMWSLPYNYSAQAPFRHYQSLLAPELASELKNARSLASFKHSITKYKMHVELKVCLLPDSKVQDIRQRLKHRFADSTRMEWRWLSLDQAAKLLVSSLGHKALAKLQEAKDFSYLLRPLH